MSKDNATERTQLPYGPLTRSKQISANEHAVLRVIESHTQFLRVSLSELGEQIQKSARTVQRIINSLVRKGLIKKKYTLFKKLKLSIVSIEEQKKLMKFGMVKHALRKVWKSKRKQPYTPPVSDIITPPMSDSTKDKTEKNKTFNIEKNFSFKGDNRTLSDKKNEQLEKFRNLFPNLEYWNLCK